MANQHTDSLNHRALKEKGCSLEVFLKDCVSKNWTLEDVAKSLRSSAPSVRKWAKRYGIEISCSSKAQPKLNQFWELFGKVELNEANLLSRAWHTLKGEGNEVRV